jgi:hypothetical protein
LNYEALQIREARLKEYIVSAILSYPFSSRMVLTALSTHKTASFTGSCTIIESNPSWHNLGYIKWSDEIMGTCFRGGRQNDEKYNSDRMQFGSIRGGTADHGSREQSWAECQRQA